VLFSRDDVASFINANFEPAWESVRPVPMVHIDFGNGIKLTRTLNGNIATYATSAEGQVLDLIAGVYDPEGYKARLEQLRLLANYVDQQGKEKRTERLLDYHKGQVEAMKKNEPTPRLINIAGLSKAKIEGGLKAMLIKGVKDNRPAPVAPAPGTPLTGEDVASFKYLLEDTRANETIRRRQVSELLASTGAIRPEAIVKKVYKDILHADLDDPYLGLGSTLFTNYPFKDEDKGTPR